jgi:hypothetical protein
MIYSFHVLFVLGAFFPVQLNDSLMQQLKSKKKELQVREEEKEAAELERKRQGLLSLSSSSNDLFFSRSFCSWRFLSSSAASFSSSKRQLNWKESAKNKKNVKRINHLKNC